MIKVGGYELKEIMCSTAHLKQKPLPTATLLKRGKLST